MSNITTEPTTAVRQAHDVFARNVRVIMAREEVRTADLAKRIGRPYAYVWQRVTDRRTPDLADLALIANALHVSVSDLVADQEPTTSFIPGSAS